MLNLMGKKWWFFVLSLVIILPGTISLFLYGLNLGVDFTGGALLEYKFERSINKDNLHEKIVKQNIEVSSIADSGNNTYIIKTKPVDGQKILEVKKELEKDFVDKMQRLLLVVLLFLDVYAYDEDI